MNQVQKLCFLLLVSVASVFSVVSSSRADAFEEQVDLAPIERAVAQHDSTLQTLDTIARQALSQMNGRATIDGQNPVYTLFDMSFRPAEYADRAIVRINHLPLRQDLADAIGLKEGTDEYHEFLKEARVPPTFYLDPAVQARLERIESRELHKADAVRQFRQQAETARAFLESSIMPPVRMLPPAEGEGSDGKWHALVELIQSPESLRGYEAEAVAQVIKSSADLRAAWIDRDASSANAAIEELADALVAVNPAAYPSETKRRVEVAYNGLTKLTLPGAMIYFGALVCLLLSAYGEAPRLRLWGIRLLLLGLLVHTLGIAVRWWLVEKSTNDWFHAIPIKNQFESVMFSAWFGAIVGLFLELRRKKNGGGGVFGAAAAFVGFLSLLALFAAPHVWRDIGGDIRQVGGILMSYWLYVHVTTVVASYALIGMNFLIAIWWLVAKARGMGQTAPAALSLASNDGMFRTLGRAMFLPVGGGSTAGAFSTDEPASPGKPLLTRLDAANVVILQLAFWLLGVGIVLGAVWADMSWGRPWGWDPKETFALVTWIVYLIILHVRLVTPNKALWTAILSVIGFFIMLFNWIGVNFFLVGLHSYA